MARKYKSMKDRIIKNSRVNIKYSYDGRFCRDWTGSVFPNGYGRIGTRFKRGPRRGQGRSTQAHRESARAFKPWLKIGTKNIVHHWCNRPICVEPHHLTGTVQRKNIQICVEQGRHKSPFRRKNGERYTASKAT